MLRAHIADFHAELPPDFLPETPVAVLAPYIATPTLGTERFVTLARAAGLRPVLLEYSEDKHAFGNRDKYRLCRPAFAVPELQQPSLRLVDLERLDTRPRPRPRLCDIRTKNGWPLVDWHHALLDATGIIEPRDVIDYSTWFRQSCAGEHYYLRYLALFVGHGILFENFLTDMEEYHFFRERVLPAVEQLQARFDVRPLIVPLLPLESESSDLWRCHPGHLYQQARDLSRFDAVGRDA